MGPTTEILPGLPNTVLFYAILGLVGVVLMFVFVLVFNVILNRALHNDLLSPQGHRQLQVKRREVLEKDEDESGQRTVREF